VKRTGLLPLRGIPLIRRELHFSTRMASSTPPSSKPRRPSQHGKQQDTTTSPSPDTTPIPSRIASPDLPLTMTASAILTSLPRDATAALAEANSPSSTPSKPPALQLPEKIVVRFKPVGAAPALRHEKSKVGTEQRFETVVGYLRRVLRLKETESVFLYVNSAFAPALDEVVGNLWSVSLDCGGCCGGSQCTRLMRTYVWRGAVLQGFE
jgi:ubiquitin-like protein ATG12